MSSAKFCSPCEQARLTSCDLLTELQLLVSAYLRPALRQDALGNTEITLTFGDDLGAQPGEPAFEADRVDYRITCAGTTPGTLPIPPDPSGGDVDYDDSLDFSSAFEIVDGQDPPVWTRVTDLPPGDCTVSLTVYRKGAVACLGSEASTVVEDATTKLSIELLCSVIVDLGDGTGDTDGEFQFSVGNECRKIWDFRTIPAVVPLGETSTTIQTVAQDLDETSGTRCDPQSCDDAKTAQLFARTRHRP